MNAFFVAVCLSLLPAQLPVAIIYPSGARKKSFTAHPSLFEENVSNNNLSISAGMHL